MTIELNRTTFRRLAQLNLLSLFVWLPLAWWEATRPGWVSFSLEFDRLVERTFGAAELSSPMDEIVLGGLGALLVWMLASAIGLLWFKRWARFGFWLSMAVAVVALVIIDGNRPTYSTPLQDLLMLMEGIVAGAIILLSYARGLGAEWFASTR